MAFILWLLIWMMRDFLVFKQLIIKATVYSDPVAMSSVQSTCAQTVTFAASHKIFLSGTCCFSTTFSALRCLSF